MDFSDGHSADCRAAGISRPTARSASLRASSRNDMMRCDLPRHLSPRTLQLDRRCGAFLVSSQKVGLFSSKDFGCVIARNEAILRLQGGDCAAGLRQNAPRNDITTERVVLSKQHVFNVFLILDREFIHGDRIISRATFQIYHAYCWSSSNSHPARCVCPLNPQLSSASHQSGCRHPNLAATHALVYEVLHLTLYPCPSFTPKI